MTASVLRLGPSPLAAAAAIVLALLASVSVAQQQIHETAQMIPELPPAPGELGHTRMSNSSGDWRTGTDLPEYFKLVPPSEGTGLCPVFFPPSPPPVDGVGTFALADHARFLAPEEIAEYVGAPFYAPLSTCFALDLLSRRHKARLAAYQQTKQTLLRELQEKLSSTQHLDRETRRQEIATFARQQTPHIAQWEQAADALREDLISAGTDWNQERTWRLGDPTSSHTPVTASLEVMRAAVFYQKGLSSAQRGLLREVAMELESPTLQGGALGHDPSLIFFSPDTARLRLTDRIPADLASKLAEYQTRKSALRKELFDAIEQNDKSTLGFKRSAALRALARAQAPKIAALEVFADEIRDDFSTIPDPFPRPRLPAWPTALLDRLAAHAENRKQVARRHRDTMQQITRQLLAATARRDVGGLRAAGALTDELKRNYASDMALLAEEANELSREIARTFPSELAQSGKTAEMMLSHVLLLRHRYEQRDIYHQYRIAMLEVGLSPEQRRLLFQTAIERLELPLPNGSLQPH